jgi:sigma-B regulation protein RsbU (phosphoserine phosphatase)
MVRIEVGDLLLHYTDGLVDAQNPDGELFGIQRGVEIIRANATGVAGEIQAALLNGVMAFMDEEPQFDDITLVLVKRTA